MALECSIYIAAGDVVPGRGTEAVYIGPAWDKKSNITPDYAAYQYYKDIPMREVDIHTSPPAATRSLHP